MAGALVPHEDDSQYVSVVLRVKRKRGTVEEGPPDALVLASKVIKLEEEDKDSNGVGNGTTVDLWVAFIFIFVSVDSIFHWCGSYNENKKEKEDDKPLLVSVRHNNYYYYGQAPPLFSTFLAKKRRLCSSLVHSIFSLSPVGCC